MLQIATIMLFERLLIKLTVHKIETGLHFHVVPFFYFLMNELHIQQQIHRICT